MEQFRLELRVVFYRDADVWIAHCLEMDLMGHGKTRKSAFTMMNNAIASHIKTSIEHHNQANIFQPADARFFQMYALGQNVARGVVDVKQSKRVSSDLWPVSAIESREYSAAAYA